MPFEHKTELLSVWVDKETKAAFAKSTSEDAELELIQSLINRNNKSMQGDLEAMEDDVLQFRGILLNYKKAYKAALEEHSEATYKIWEDLDAQLPSLRQKVAKFETEVMPLFQSADTMMKTLERVSAKMEHINTFQLEKMVDLIKTIQGCDDETKSVLQKVLGA